MKRLLPVALVATALLLTGCTTPPPSTPTETDQSARSTETPTPTPEPEPAKADGTRTAPYPYGTLARVSEESLWDFTIHSPQADANTWVAQADPYNEAPTEGNSWVGANIAVTVRDVPEAATAGQEPVSVGSSLVPVYVGASGTIYDSWTINYPAAFAGEMWNATPDAFVTPGMQWDKPFALQVPAAEVEGGAFAVSHTVTGKVIFFGG